MRGVRCICLTFELSGERRYSAWPARRMMAVSASRAKCYAGAIPLQRRVRRHCVALAGCRPERKAALMSPGRLATPLTTPGPPLRQ
jgi:hypothetical protein